ncbi:unnamed protein product [Malus baccata var. baccata]
MMSALGGQLVILPSFLCVYIVLLLIKIFHKLWWTPTRLQKLMALQGITGPPYRLIHGNTKEITDMIKEAMSRPKNLSHDVFSVVQPHIHSWTQIYAMVASTETMLEKWKSYEGKEIEVFQEFRLFSSEVISRTAFGSNYIEGKNIFETLAKLGVLVFKNSLTIRVPVFRIFWIIRAKFFFLFDVRRNM